ncbi:MAG: glycosyltransferase family 4 protein [Opitutales bacterium]
MPAASEKPRILLITQVYPPDPAAVGQYMAELGEALAARGWDARVLASGRGYDDPSLKYPPKETLRGVRVRRLPWSSLGKKTILHRLAGQALFCVQAILRGLFTRRLGLIVITTSPPMGSVVGLTLGIVRRCPVAYWVMDINPDQAILLGKARADSPLVRAFEAFDRAILRRARTIVTLDTYMAERLQAKAPEAAERIAAGAPWPMEERITRIEHADNPFRRTHGLEGKTVVMYSGNHSLAHPLDTVLEAALRLRDHPTLVFLFVGGGHAKKPIDDAIASEQPPNLKSLPYQPLETLSESLSAADVHLVAMGTQMVGVVHPCKVYGALALAKPICFIGPRPSHVTDLIDEANCGWAVPQGDVEGLVARFEAIAAADPAELELRGRRGRDLVAARFSKRVLCEQVCTKLETVVRV